MAEKKLTNRPFGFWNGLLACLYLIGLLPVAVFPQKTESPDTLHYLTDYSDTVQASEASKLDSVLYELEQRSHIEFRIVLTESTGDLTSFAYAEKIWKDWRIGALSGEAVLVVFVTRNRECRVSVSQRLTEELPYSELDNIRESGTSQITLNGYAQAAEVVVRRIIDKLGRRRGFNYEELTTVNRSPSEIPLRTANPPFRISFWQLIKIVGGLTLSIFGVIAVVVFGLGVISSALTFIRNAFEAENRSDHFKELIKKGVGFAVSAGLVYYFWEPIKLFLNFGKLLGEGVALIGACLFPVIGLLVFVLLLYALKHAGRRWARSIRANKGIFSKPIIITLSLPLLLLVLPRSQISLVNSWSGKAAVRYGANNFGEVTSLQLKGGSLHDLNELAGLETLTSLNMLDIENVPLEGIQDVSRLSSLKWLRVRHTALIGLKGLEHLKQLERLDLSGINSDAIGALERLPKLRQLGLSNCAVKDLSAIGRLSHLEMLTLDHTDINNLEPLSELPNLTYLSIVGTSAKDLRPLRQLPLFALDITDTRINKEGVEATFKRPMVAINGRTGIDEVISNPAWSLIPFFDRLLVPADARSRRNTTIIVLVLAFILLQSSRFFRPLRTYSVFLLRRIFMRVAWGVIFVAILLTLASIQLPGFATREANMILPDVASSLTKWAWIVSVGWLGIRPALLLSLETKWLNSTIWCIPASFLERLMPAIVILAPVSYRVISSASSPTDFITTVWFWLLIVFFGVPWLIVAIVIIASMVNWRSRLRALQTIASPPAVIEIPLRRSLADSIFGGMDCISLASPKGGKAQDQQVLRPVITASSLAMMSRIDVNSHEDVAASVFTLRKRDLINLRPWELELIQEWTSRNYQHSWSPIWLVGDWVETLKPQSPSIQKNLDKLDELSTKLSGTEHRFKIGATVFPLSGEERLLQCLVANEVIPRQELDSRSLDSLLDTAFTPVAVLLRSTFGFADFADRLDVLMRATETAIAFFCLVLVIEYEKDRGRFSSSIQEEIDHGLRENFKPPITFANWRALLLTFAKQQATELAAALDRSIREPPAKESQMLRALLESSAGLEAVNSVGELKSRRQMLTLLNQARNLLTAHGPAVERATPEVYQMTFLVVLDLLGALPWSEVCVCSREQKQVIAYRGVQPKGVAINHPINNGPIFVWIDDGAKKRGLDANKYFHVPPGASEMNSIAMFIGEQGYFDPITGLRV